MEENKGLGKGEEGKEMGWCDLGEKGYFPALRRMGGHGTVSGVRQHA